MDNSSRAKSPTTLPVPQTKLTKAKAAASAVSPTNMTAKYNHHMMAKTPKPATPKAAVDKPFVPRVCIYIAYALSLAF